MLFSAFLQAEDVNVVVVDWNAGADNNYAAAVANTVTSGKTCEHPTTWI